MFSSDELKQLKDVVSTELKIELQPMKEDISSLKTDVSGLKKFAKATTKKLKQIHIDQNVIIQTFDERTLELKQEVSKIKQFLHLP